MDEDGHLAQVYVSEGVRPCRYRLQLAKDCFYGASSPKIPDITMLRSGHRICYTVNLCVTGTTGSLYLDAEFFLDAHTPPGRG